MSIKSPSKPGKPYAHHYPEVWTSAAFAQTSLIALQAYLMKPLEKVNEDNIEGLVDTTVANLLQIKHLLDAKLNERSTSSATGEIDVPIH